jgi:hypothetical protein
MQRYRQSGSELKGWHLAVLGQNPHGVVTMAGEERMHRLPQAFRRRALCCRRLLMPIHLDHLMVPARDKIAAARLLAELLGVPWSTTGVGPFAPVFLNDGFTIDFDEWPEPIPRIHYCFRVSEAEFDAILARIQAAGIPYRSAVHGPVDKQVDTIHGGRIVYWNEPDGHQWEMLTASYARA